jgi:hypothetical protein
MPLFKQGLREKKEKTRKKEKKKKVKWGKSLSFSLKIFNRKALIYEDPTVRSSVRLWKRDPCARIYVFIDHFEVKH